MHRIDNPTFYYIKKSILLLQECDGGIVENYLNGKFLLFIRLGNGVFFLVRGSNVRPHILSSPDIVPLFLQLPPFFYNKSKDFLRLFSVERQDILS